MHVKERGIELVVALKRRTKGLAMRKLTDWKRKMFRKRVLCDVRMQESKIANWLIWIQRNEQALHQIKLIWANGWTICRPVGCGNTDDGRMIHYIIIFAVIKYI